MSRHGDQEGPTGGQGNEGTEGVVTCQHLPSHHLRAMCRFSPLAGMTNNQDEAWQDATESRRAWLAGVAARNSWSNWWSSILVDRSFDERLKSAKIQLRWSVQGGPSC